MTKISTFSSICLDFYKQNAEFTSELGVELILVGNILCVQGSTDVRDWQQNLSAIKSRSHTHSGYYACFLSIERYVSTIIKDVDYFTGHSAGGAIAQYLTGWYEKPAICFGAPRTGIVHPKILCFENSLDLVPKLPLTYGNPNRTKVFTKFAVNPHSMEIYHEYAQTTH